MAVRGVTDESYMTSFSIGWSQHQLHHTTGATHIDFDGIPFAAGKKQTLPGRQAAKCTFNTPYIQTMSYQCHTNAVPKHHAFESKNQRD